MIDFIANKFLSSSDFLFKVNRKSFILYFLFILSILLSSFFLFSSLYYPYFIIFISLSLIFLLFSIFILLVVLRINYVVSFVASILSAMAGYSKISLDLLSKDIDLSIDKLRSDLIDFSEKGYIPTGRVSVDGNFFKIGELEGEELVDDDNNISSTSENLEFIEKGRNYLKVLEKANTSMYSNKFFNDELEKVLFSSEVLFKYIENYPTKVPNIKINVNQGLENAIKAIAEYKELARFSIDSKRIKDLKSYVTLMLQKANDDFTSVYSAIKIPDNNVKDETIINNSNDVIKSGRAYIRRISQIKSKITDENLTKIILDTEKLLEHLFNYLENHKDKTTEVKNLMNRHLPITLKVMAKYTEIQFVDKDKSSIETINREMIQAFETLNNAVVYLLQKIVGNLALDISTDIDVLKTVIARDGHIMNKSFTKKD